MYLFIHAVPQDACQRNGILYSASLRAGRQDEWGALLAGCAYYIWATWDLKKVFALRQSTPGTCCFVFDNKRDCLVQQSSSVDMQTTMSPSNAAIGVDTNCRQTSAAQNREELRAKRLASMGEAPPAAPSVTSTREELRAKRLASMGRALPAAPPHVLPETSKSRAVEHLEKLDGAESLLRLLPLEPADQLGIFAGETVLLMVALPSPSSTTMSLVFQWYHSQEEQQPGAPILGATRPVLRLSPLEVAHEGLYWCTVSMLSAGHSVDRAFSNAVASRKAKVAFAPLDRFILEQFEAVASHAEDVLPPVEDMHLLQFYSKSGHVARSTQVEIAKHVISRVDATLSLSNATRLGSIVHVQERARKLCEQLPCEVSNLLTLRARAHLACAMWATLQHRNGEANDHAQQSRCHASAALKLLPGDRDALRVHASACYQCGRLGDAIESLERLLRITPLSSPLHTQHRERLATMQSKLDSEWKRHRAKMKAEAASTADTSHGFRGWKKTEANSDTGKESPQKEAADNNYQHRWEHSPGPETTAPVGAKGTSARVLPKRGWREIFDQQEEQWNAFIRRLKHSTGAVAKLTSLHEVPWPDGGLRGFHFVGVGDGAPRQEKRKAIKKMLLRWHPDKFCTFTSKFAQVTIGRPRV
jgi:hypothetical protein